MTLVQVSGLTKRFGDVTAVDDLSFSLEPGEVFGVLGHNGAGKTTTVRLLTGVLAPSAGAVRVFDLDPQRDGPAVRRRVGVLTETPALDDRLSARTSLRLFADIYAVPRPEVDRRVAALLDDFGLTARMDDKVGSYSRGMRQRLALARTLLHDPELVFLDEPTSGLDPAATREVQTLIGAYTRERGRAVFLCTHNLLEAQRLCTRVAILAQGRLLAMGSPRELAQRYAQRQVTVHVAAEDVDTVLSVLDGVETVAGGAPGAETIAHVTMRGIDEAGIPAMVRRLVEANVAIYRVEPQEPSLEDVYFALQAKPKERA